jgi:tryptophanyl-tRNA synthetase
VFTLHKHFADEETVADVAYQCRNALRGCVDCKRILSENIAETFAPMRERAAHFREHPEEVRSILDEGAERARSIARETMAEVRHKMGLDWREAID